MNWITIKYFGRVKYFNISYATILVLPIYIDFAQKINNTSGIDLANIPISIRLIYLASLLYALGIAIYQYACPKIIKDYDKVQDYIRDNFNIYLLSYPDLKYNIVTANLADIQKKTKEKLEALHLQVEQDPTNSSKKKELEDLVELYLPSCVQSNLTNEFNQELSTRKFWMIMSFVLYVLGTVVVLFLLVKKSIVVLTFI
jgi:hypothetical protein